MKKKENNAVVRFINKLIEMRQKKNGVLLFWLINLVVWALFALVIYCKKFGPEIAVAENPKMAIKTFCIFVLAFPMYVSIIFDVIALFLSFLANTCGLPLNVHGYDFTMENLHVYRLFYPFIALGVRHIMMLRTYVLYQLKEKHLSR